MLCARRGLQCNFILGNCVEVRHIFRESNVEVDFLANLGCNRAAPIWVCAPDLTDENGFCAAVLNVETG